MDINLARTFLAVVETGSFIDAANQVFVSQSTVSARIKTLEEQLGKVLFERSKSGATLTSAGFQFQKHAQAMVRIWHHARLEIALPEGYEGSLSIGGQYSLWDGFLINWLTLMRAKVPKLAIRGQFGFSDRLMQDLFDGTIDIGVMYTPQGRPGIAVEQLFEDEIVMVSSDRNAIGASAENYVLIDWGPEFRTDHALNFPDIATPGTYLDLGSLSLQYLLASGASGYVPIRLIRDQLANQILHLVPDTPRFNYPAYVVYSNSGDEQALETAIEALKSIAQRI